MGNIKDEMGGPDPEGGDVLLPGADAHTKDVPKPRTVQPDVRLAGKKVDVTPEAAQALKQSAAEGITSARPLHPQVHEEIRKLAGLPEKKTARPVPPKDGFVIGDDAPEAKIKVSDLKTADEVHAGDMKNPEYAAAYEAEKDEEPQPKASAWKRFVAYLKDQQKGSV